MGCLILNLSIKGGISIDKGLRHQTMIGIQYGEQEHYKSTTTTLLCWRVEVVSGKTLWPSTSFVSS